MEQADDEVMEAGQGNVQALRFGAETTDERVLWARFRDAETPEAFIASWLALQCHLLEGVVSGVVLTRSDADSPFEYSASWPDVGSPQRHLVTAAERAVEEGRALALELEPEGDAGGSSEPRAVIAQVVEGSGRHLGVVALELRPRPSIELERALRRLAWGIPWLELCLERRGGGMGSVAQLDLLLDIIASPLEQDRFKAAAASFVTELATRLACERVSIGFWEKNRVRLCGVSHSARFSERANLSRAIEAAMDESFDQQQPIDWPGDPARPVVTRAHEGLAKESGAGVLLSVPIARGSEFVAVVTLERPEGREFVDSERRMIEAASDLVGPMLDIQRRDDRWIGRKLIDAGRESLQRLVGPRHVALKLAVLGFSGLLLSMMLSTGSYRVAADVTMEARVMRASVAPFDGYLAEAPARAGDRVAEGELLARLDDREMVLERARWSSQVAQLGRQQRQAMAERDAARVKIVSAQYDQARARFDLIETQLERTRLVAPFDGIVVTGDWSQRLGSPIGRGELLFEVAPLDEFRVAIAVDERDIDEIEIGQQGELVFSAFPREHFDLTITRLTPVSEAREGRNTFRVEASLAETPPRLQPGMEGVAKIDIGERRLFWIWTHEVADWMRLGVWRWTP